MVNNPPPKRNKAYPIMIMEIASDDGFVFEILSNHLRNEKDVDEACFLNFFAICCFLIINQVGGCFFCPFSC